MELLLNLAWLLLALPAYWLWRQSSAERAGQNFRALQCLLALGCALVVLFPVISATDDLRAMRAEMEESPASKRNIRQASIDRTGVGRWQNPAAVAGRAPSFAVNDEQWLKASHARLSTPVAPAIERVSRGPPFFSLLA
jgi:hypothetical protein